MRGIYVSVPIACFRKGLARDFWETEIIPPPATCYGFLLSLVGETRRSRHIGVGVSAGILRRPWKGKVLRTAWRVKTSSGLGHGSNVTPTEQELLTCGEFVIWLDSHGEKEPPTLEERVGQALVHPEKVARFGGLCLGESSHLVDEVLPIERRPFPSQELYVARAGGAMSLPVWVDHVGSAGTRYSAGVIEKRECVPPRLDELSLVNDV